MVVLNLIILEYPIPSPTANHNTSISHEPVRADSHLEYAHIPHMRRRRRKGRTFYTG